MSSAGGEPLKHRLTTTYIRRCGKCRRRCHANSCTSGEHESRSAESRNPCTEGSPMYRIEIKPGEETALRTIEELAVGIRNGVITSRARIWHNAGQKWLPIEFHPHYRAALRQLETGSSDEPAQAALVPSPVLPLATPAPRAEA